MTSRLRRSRLPVLALLALAMGSAVALAGSPALAQQPQPTPPSRLFPSHPPVPGMGAPPGGRAPGVLGPDRRFPGGFPNGQPGMRPGRPQPPGFPNTRPGAPPSAKPPPRHPVPHEDEEHGGAPDRECPGFGPDDTPPPVNFWHGMFMVDNERATQPGFVNRLLFRYDNPSNPCDPRNEPPPYLAALFNFGVLAFVLYRFGRKPLAEALNKRKQAIMAEIEKAAALKAEAEARLDDYREKLRNIETKLTEVRAEYAAQAEIEQKHILAEAEERRARMRRDAEFRIEQERKAVREELLGEAVIAATTGAEELIRKTIASADQDRMAADFLTTVGAVMMGAPARPPPSTGARS